jgi:hypothetical protein
VKRSSPASAIDKALDALALVGAIERLIRDVLQRSTGPDVMPVIRWLSRHNDRDRLAALRMLRVALANRPSEAPASLLEWVRGHAQPPCYVPAAALADLRARLVDAAPEPSLFDGGFP